MLAFNRLGRLVGVVLPLVLLTTAAEARTRKGEKYLKEGRIAEGKRDFDRALELYELAMGEDPTDAAYQMAARRVRFQASQYHTDQGQKLREEGKLEEALAEFRRAFAIDPGSTIATTEIRRTLGRIEAEKRKKAPEAPGPAPAAPVQDLEARLTSLQPAPELRPLARQIGTLKINNQPVKILFETLSKLAGINVIWDPEYQSTGKNYSVDLSNTDLEEALNHLAVLTKTFWKPLSANTVFLTNDNVTKRRDYEDMVVRTFYLRNLTTPQELQEIATILRSVTDIRRVFTYNSQNVIMVRGTGDQVALAEKLVTDLDKPKAEVVLDIVVMEANRSRTRDLAATFLSGGTNGLRLPVSFTPRPGLAVSAGTGTGNTTVDGTSSGTGSTTSSLVRLTQLGEIGAGDFAISIPNALLQALMSDRSTRVLVSPQIRATHGQKASLKIGDKYPYATGSFQPGVGAIGVSPLVSTQFQFADVGVNVDLTPTIHGEDEVSMQVEIDISNIRDRIDVGGLSQPVIGQRKFTHNVRLAEGEVSLLGGLNQNQDTRSVSGTAGLATIPVLGRLFSGEGIEKSTGELLVALVPHIVRAPEITDLNLRGIAAGSDTVVKLSYAARRAPAPAAPKPELKPPVTALPIPGAPGGTGVTPAPAVPTVPGAGAAASTRLRFNPPGGKMALSGTLTVTLEIDGARELFGGPMRLKWDPKVLRLSEVTRGELMGGAGQTPIFTRNIRNDEGEVAVILSRPAGAAGVSGSGTLVSLVFQAVGKGATAVSFVELGLRDTQQQPVNLETPVLTVSVE